MVTRPNRKDKKTAPLTDIYKHTNLNSKTNTVSQKHINTYKKVNTTTQTSIERHRDIDVKKGTHIYS